MNFLVTTHFIGYRELVLLKEKRVNIMTNGKYCFSELSEELQIQAREWIEEDPESYRYNIINNTIITCER